MVFVDAHLDLSYNAVLRGRDVTQPAERQPAVEEGEIATVGLPNLRAGGVGLICATIFCPPKSYAKREGYTTAEQAHAEAIKQWEWYQRQISAGELRMVQCAGDLPSPEAPIGGRGGKAIPFVLLLEGADAFRSADDVAEWHARGLRIVGLAWRGTRMAGGTGSPGPLTAEGKAIVRAMDRLGMIHDISHLAEESFWQLMDLTDRAVMASHSNCRAIVPGDRQIDDRMIREIARRGGVIGINFYDKFLMPPSEYGKRRCRLADVLAHVSRICDLTGSIQHVGLGTDMDGGLGRNEIPRQISTSADLPRLANAMSDGGYGDEDIRRVMGENWLEFFRRAIK